MLFKKKIGFAVGFVASAFSFASCVGASSGGDAGSGAILGTDQVTGSSMQLPWPDEAQAVDPESITLALRYVTYVDENGAPIISAEETKKVVQRVNDLYTSCKVHFRVEEYLQVVPKDRGLEFSLSSMGELPSTRKEFDEASRLVVINTGNWQHSTIGSANAWTTMPGSSPSGAVIEGKVADSAEIIAHELGHYLNLDHVDNPSNLLNPIIYSSSTALTASQCEEVRNAAKTVRAEAIRT